MHSVTHTFASMTDCPKLETGAITLSEQLLEFFQCNPNDFLLQLVTMDETWLYHYDPETKHQWSGDSG